MPDGNEPDATGTPTCRALRKTADATRRYVHDVTGGKRGGSVCMRITELVDLTLLSAAETRSSGNASTTRIRVEPTGPGRLRKKTVAVPVPMLKPYWVPCRHTVGGIGLPSQGRQATLLDLRLNAELQPVLRWPRLMEQSPTEHAGAEKYRRLVDEDIAVVGA